MLGDACLAFIAVHSQLQLMIKVPVISRVFQCEYWMLLCSSICNVYKYFQIPLISTSRPVQAAVHVCPRFGHPMTMSWTSKQASCTLFIQIIIKNISFDVCSLKWSLYTRRCAPPGNHYRYNESVQTKKLDVQGRHSEQLACLNKSAWHSFTEACHSFWP